MQNAGEGVGSDNINARYYDGTRGQFLSEDPSFIAIGDPKNLQSVLSQDQSSLLADPQQMNSYSYGRDNLIIQKDPSGNSPIIAALVLLLAPLPAYAPASSKDLTNLRNQPPTIFFGGEAIPLEGMPVPGGNIPTNGTYFRGGSTFDIRGREGIDYKVDPKTGYVLNTHGPSVNVNPNDPNVVTYGGPNQVMSHPQELQIIDKASGKGQLIVPKNGVNLTVQQFQESFNKIQTQPYISGESTPATIIKRK